MFKNYYALRLVLFDQPELGSSSLHHLTGRTQQLEIDRLPVVRACKWPSTIVPLCPTFLLAVPPLKMYLLQQETTTLLDSTTLCKRLGPWPCGSRTINPVMTTFEISHA